nr:protein scai [Hymenolepis microstoma]
MASVERSLQGRDLFPNVEVISKNAIVAEFCHLLEKSKQLFNGLRDLPQYGHKQWQTYFGRTFDVYTKLWKFQRHHREVLDDVYGLSRWQIGEIASKIAQLYYHYYLRTSDTSYLMEAFSFFTAIHERKYFAHISKDDATDQAVKKLRYYARFIIVCLLLKRVATARELIKEFNIHILDHTNNFDAVAQAEWSSVVKQIQSFVDADNVCTILNVDSSPVVVSARLAQYTCPPIDTGNNVRSLELSEIIIVGNTFDQVKFSEITIDMFRILQCVERDPKDCSRRTPAALFPQKSFENGDGYELPFPSPNLSDKRFKNPHKYLLYKPSFSLFNTFMATGFKDLPSDGALLLYISADGLTWSENFAHPETSVASGFDFGGVVTNPLREGGTGPKTKLKPYHRDPHCIHPGDLLAYTRKPLFLIIDSDNSSAFKNFQSIFSQPLVCLLSPNTLPTVYDCDRRKGNLFTLFLYCPLMGLLQVCRFSNISLKTWERAASLVDSFMGECCRILLRARQLDPSIQQFLYVDFLRIFILRFCFCSMVFRLHRDFHDYPSSQPAFPISDIMESRILQKIFSDLTRLLEVESQFATPTDFSRDWLERKVSLVES